MSVRSFSSSFVETKEMALPLVSKRPALPTLCMYSSDSIGMSKLMTRFTFSISIPLPNKFVETSTLFLPSLNSE